MRFLLMLLFSISANAKPCKIVRTDNVTLYGNCFKVDKAVMFYSCIEFSCQVPSSVTRQLDQKEETCKIEKSEDIIISEMKKEHSVSDLSQAPFCQYTQSQTDLVVDDKKPLVDQIKEVLKKQK